MSAGITSCLQNFLVLLKCSGWWHAPVFTALKWQTEINRKKLLGCDGVEHCLLHQACKIISVLCQAGVVDIGSSFCRFLKCTPEGCHHNGLCSMLRVAAVWISFVWLYETVCSTDMFWSLVESVVLGWVGRPCGPAVCGGSLVLGAQAPPIAEGVSRRVCDWSWSVRLNSCNHGSTRQHSTAGSSQDSSVFD